MVPVLVAATFATLLFPRAAAPESLPLPAVDGRAIDRMEGEDRARVERARREGLHGDVRELGSAIRAFNRLQSDPAAASPGSEETELGLARAALDRLGPRVTAEHGVEALRALRAVQLESFLEEVRKFERSPDAPPTEELFAASGTFVTRMTDVGWCTPEHRVLLDEHERRIAFKAMWNNVVGALHPELALTLDEQRALYAFYLRHPHAPIAVRRAVAMARADGPGERDARDLEARERAGAMEWRLAKIRELGQLDAAYPTVFASGVAEYQLGRFESAAQSFEGWLRAHPDGPMSLRARNHLKAALDAHHDSF